MAKIYDDPTHKYKWDDDRPILWKEGEYYVVPCARGDGFIARKVKHGKLSGEIHKTLIEATQEIEQCLIDEVMDTGDLYE